MKKTILLVMVMLIAMSATAMAARLVNVPIPHPPITLYQAYCGLTCTTELADPPSTVPVGNRLQQGLLGEDGDVIEAVPGIFAFDPGVQNTAVNGDSWPNFVSASQAGISGLHWTVTNVSLRKTVPVFDCTAPDVPRKSYLKQGLTTKQIESWWPLMYELPGTVFTLTVSYKTNIAWDDDGPGPNSPQFSLHQDIWTWKVDATFDSLENLIDLFRELPAGTCQVPLINGDDVYEDLEDTIDALELMDPADPEMAQLFNTFVMDVEDYCTLTECGVCDGAIGIRNTNENPACCKILADLDWIDIQLGINPVPELPLLPIH